MSKAFCKFLKDALPSLLTLGRHQGGVVMTLDGEREIEPFFQSASLEHVPCSDNGCDGHISSSSVAQPGNR